MVPVINVKVLNHDFHKIFKINRVFHLGNLENLMKIVVQDKSHSKIYCAGLISFIINCIVVFPLNVFSSIV